MLRLFMNITHFSADCSFKATAHYLTPVLTSTPRPGYDRPAGTQLVNGRATLTAQSRVARAITDRAVLLTRGEGTVYQDDTPRCCEKVHRTEGCWAGCDASQSIRAGVKIMLKIKLLHGGSLLMDVCIYGLIESCLKMIMRVICL